MADELLKIKEQVYKDPRPAEAFVGFHQRTRSRKPNFVYELVRLTMTAIYVPLNRVTAIDEQNVPAKGPVILVPNHFSFIDHFYLGFYIRRRVQFMAKSQLFTKPMQWMFSPGGVFPIRRGEQDQEAFITAHAILNRQGAIVMYAEGGRSRTGELGEPRPGAGRLALESGVTVVPVAISGSQYKKLRFPPVTVQYGKPVRFEKIAKPTREQQLAASRMIFDRVKEMYAELGRQGH